MTARLRRRDVIGGLAAVPLLCTLAPKPAAAAVSPALADALKQLGIDPVAILWDRSITLTAPAIAEDGAAVPIGVAVERSTPVRQIHVFAPANRLALVASLSPLSPEAVPDFQLRIRLGQSQTIVAVARLSDGRVVAAAAEVHVTAGGGCRT